MVTVKFPEREISHERSLMDSIKTSTISLRKKSRNATEIQISLRIGVLSSVTCMKI